MGRVSELDSRSREHIPFTVSADTDRQSLAGRAVCCARLVQASGEKSRQNLLSRYTPSTNFVTPFALGRLKFCFPCGAMVKLTSQAVLALTSVRFKICGAQRCAHSFHCLCPPLPLGLPPQPLTPSAGGLARTCRLRHSTGVSPSVFSYVGRTKSSRELLRLFLRSCV